MSRQQIELRTLALVEIVTSGGRIEDVTAEAKAIWPDVKKAPRQLAAHANTARGEPILWIVGLDEKTHQVVGAGDVELAEWWPAVQSAFDERTAPDLIPLVVAVSVDQTVVALSFSTDRAPYVVKRQSPEGWSENDVPWRDGNRTRSAHRDELLRMLAPAIVPPSVDVVDMRLYLNTSWRDLEQPPSETIDFTLAGEVFFGPPSARVVVLPSHGMKANLVFGREGEAPVVVEMKISMRNPGYHGHTGWKEYDVHPLGVDCRSGAVYVTGAGRVTLEAHAQRPEAELPFFQMYSTVEARITLPVAGSDRPVSFTTRLREASRVVEWEDTKTEYLARWTLDES